MVIQLQTRNSLSTAKAECMALVVVNEMSSVTCFIHLIPGIKEVGIEFPCFKPMTKCHMFALAQRQKQPT